MSWQIHIPHRHRSDSLSDVAVAAHDLPADEARVVRQLVLGEIVGGSAASAGELIDKLEKATPAERRQALDAARAKAGLKTATDLDVQKQIEATSRQSVSMRDHRLEPAPGGGFVDVTDQENEAHRTAASLESRRRAQESLEADRRVGAEAIRVREQAEREQLDREVPQGVPR